MKRTNKKPDREGWWWIKWSDSSSEICYVWFADGERYVNCGLSDNDLMMVEFGSLHHSVEFSTEPIREPGK